MQTQSKAFACGKAVALGALYDAVEKLKWKLVSANSDTGILMTSERKKGTLYLIRVLPEQGGQVEITMELASGTFASDTTGIALAEQLYNTLTKIIEEAISREQ